jgi:epoxyqueuosine reductase
MENVSQSVIKEFITKKAMELDFVKVGFAKCEKVEVESEFKNWINNSYHAEMKWMENYSEKRMDPSLLLDNAKTMVVFATNYYNKNNKIADEFSFARYALGTDYHELIKNKLNGILNELKEKYQINGRAFVDTAPILERYWAEKSGIGWIGKNCNLITRDYGSFVFLSEIIIDYDLNPDQKHKNFCGTCDKCIKSCPTDAFVKENVLDSKKCISYITIEKREEFTETESKMIGNNIYGCDICQDVCPWNRFAKETQITEFQARESIIEKSAKDWLEIDIETYQDTFRKSAVKRAKYSGLKRNILASAKNTKLIR